MNIKCWTILLKHHMCHQTGSIEEIHVVCPSMSELELYRFEVLHSSVDSFMRTSNSLLCWFLTQTNKIWGCRTKLCQNPASVLAISPGAKIGTIYFLYILSSGQSPAGKGPCISTIQPVLRQVERRYRSPGPQNLWECHLVSQGNGPLPCFIGWFIEQSTPSTYTLHVLPLSYLRRFCHFI